MSNDDQQLLAQALTRIRDLKAEVERLSRAAGRDVAAIGCAMKFPGGVDSLDTFADLLHSGRDAIGPVPTSRWDATQYFHNDPETPGRMHARAAAFVDDIDSFDAAFFGISAREAIDMDPQQRLLLEVVWSALEDAGLPPRSLAGSRTGVYLALSSDDYAHASNHSGDAKRITAYSALGNARSIAAGRISYVLDLAGPCMQIDTACSSSLTGIHLASEALLRGEIDLAIVAGASLIVSPHSSVAFSKLRALSADGRCKPFDARADGYGRGEGVAALVLKRTLDAADDMNRVIAVIKGSAMNHDGRSNGLTAPNGSRQEDVMREALKSAKVDPASIRYVEAHGTGTPLGDPIEFISTGNVYAAAGTRAEPLLIGSVKANIGHLEAVAGLAGLFKLLIVCRDGSVPPAHGFQQPNPRIPWSRYDMSLNERPQTLAGTEPLRAAISAFGMSGTNCHIILEQHRPGDLPEQPAPSGPHLLCLSARTEPALKAQLAQFRVFLSETRHSLAQVCRSACVSRDHFEHRVALVAVNTASMCAAIDEALTGANALFKVSRRNTGVVLSLPEPALLPQDVFQALMDEQPAFQAAWNAAWECLGSGDAPRLAQRQAAGLGAALAEQYALAKMWLGWGLRAQVAGEGLGRLTAALVDRTLALKDVADWLLAQGQQARVSGLDLSGLLHLNEAPPAADHDLVIELATPDAPLPAIMMWPTQLAGLYRLGVAMDWPAVAGGAKRAHVPLPLYPFERTRFWKERPAPESGLNAGKPARQFKLEGALVRVMDDHRIFSRPVAPGALLLSLAEASLQSPDSRFVQLAAVSFLQPFVLDAPAATNAALLVITKGAGLTASSLVQGHAQATDHMKARVETAPHDGPSPAPSFPYLDQPGETIYGDQAQRGIELGASFRWIQRFSVGDSESWGMLSAPEGLVPVEGLYFHPGLIDSCLHLLRPLHDRASDTTLVPFHIDRVRLASREVGPGPLWCHARKTAGPQGQQEALGDIDLYDSDLQPLMSLRGIRARQIRPERLVAAGHTPQGLSVSTFTSVWEPVPPIPTESRAMPSSWVFIAPTALVDTFQTALHAAGAGAAQVVDIDQLARTGSQAVARSTAEDEIVLLLDLPHGDAVGPHERALAQAETLLGAQAWIRQNWRNGKPALTVVSCDAGVGNGGMGVLPPVLSHSLAAEQAVAYVRHISLTTAPSVPAFAEVLALARTTVQGGTWRLGASGLARRVHRATPQPGTAQDLALPAGTFIVTGAGGALGERVCRWLVDRGAQAIAWVSRKGAPSQSLLDHMASTGSRCAVQPFLVDVGDASAVESLFATLRSSDLPPIGGIFHLAGINSERPMALEDPQHLRESHRAKALGAWHLHVETQELPLAWFVCFSSMAGVVSNPGQFGYGSANAFLDELCAARAARGLPGLSIAWGPWADLGMGQKIGQKTLQAMQQLGIESMAPQEGLKLLEALLQSSGAGHVLAVTARQPEAFAEWVNRAPAPAPVQAQSPVATPPTASDHGDLREHLTAMVSQVLQTSLGPDTATVPLGSLGMDSLMAIELIEQINSELSLALPVTTSLLERSLDDILQWLATEKDASIPEAPEGDRPTLHRSITPGAEARWVCAHYLGGDIDVFEGWGVALGPLTEVCRIAMPRQTGEKTQGLTQLASHIADRLEELPPLPTYLYGHSMGALLSHALAIELEARRHIDLRGLAVGAMWAPAEHARSMARQTGGLASIAAQMGSILFDNLDDARLSSWRRTTERDWESMRTHCPALDTPLHCPVLAIGGRDDSVVSAAEMAGWQQSSQGPFIQRELPGAHLFLRDSFELTDLLAAWSSNHESTT
jgi:acyl transferase domain-containing protein/surfactin synthase thioesterase subunit